MRTTLSPALWLPLLALTLGACGGGGGSPTAPNPTPTPAPGSASFTLVSGGQSQTIRYDGSRNLVLCTRNAGWASLFLRFAEQTAGNGQNGPHVDVDLCNHDGGGAFSPKDPTSTSCAGGKVFDLFWHPGDGSFFSNAPTASRCTLELSQTGTRLSGTFSCRELREGNGGRTVDVLDGSFECNET